MHARNEDAASRHSRVIMLPDTQTHPSETITLGPRYFEFFKWKEFRQYMGGTQNKRARYK